ncbi:hypothetical protein KAJ83_09730 [Marivibrio halodurans]|uniref:Mu-like prophage FluMu N-terminal domain-containing protein n=1 Tax=Marivibrio halodurans TaxID=2039722 RepID=A0A8J7SIU5_9PROT|nr:hypothetical protein [Marivibrio halodurans]MBP5857288.1 hypothetical protein [Marivibrio halodurans]
MSQKSRPAIEVRAFGEAGRRRAGRRFTANWSDPIPLDELSEADREAIEGDPNLAVREVTLKSAKEEKLEGDNTGEPQSGGGKNPAGKQPGGKAPPAKE